jgi:hypothetical protein
MGLPTLLVLKQANSFDVNEAYAYTVSQDGVKAIGFWVVFGGRPNFWGP